VLASRANAPFPGFWAIGVLVGANMLLELAPTRSRGQDAEGTISFIVQIAAGLLLGVFWGGIVAVLATGLSQAARRRPFIRIAFNSAQRAVSIMAAIAVYTGLGGEVPPSILQPGTVRDPGLVFGTLLAFFAGSVAYFVVNSLLVSMVVGLSTGKAVLPVWQRNSLWILGYDIAASTMALAAAWLYLQFDDGLSRLYFLLFLAPIVGAKHLYARLNHVQHLYDELDHAHDKLELALREQLEMMVKSIEARDPYTSGHSRRVAALSKAIASDLGINGDVLAEIENAALLHDVGKIHAEFAPLLQKEGRLTQEEWEIMKTHATKSAELVGLFSRFQGHVRSCVQSHHERWDGKGYPHGVVGEAIPLGARIIMISDTIDAMTTDRPYRKALTFERVVTELQKYRGSQFDPGVVDVTVNSVTVRRLVSDRAFLAEQTTTRSLALGRVRPALRSQSSFFDAVRVAARDGE